MEQKDNAIQLLEWYESVYRFLPYEKQLQFFVILDSIYPLEWDKTGGKK